ncbi:MAG: hypothetical protein LBI28_05135 [Treponema sp.]|jgi:hypothetical protein|nr:hypothetical protein [Treponema sp.]
MNKKLFFSAMLAILLVFGMTVVGCGDGSTSGDSVTIRTVNPSTLIDGVERQYTITVDYVLSTQETAQLFLDANCFPPSTLYRPDYFFYLTDVVTVDKGSGSHTFNITRKAKNWSNEYPDGKHEIMALLFSSDYNSVKGGGVRLAKSTKTVSFE